MTQDRWADLSRQELIALGRGVVTERLRALGCTVREASSGSGFDVTTPSGRELVLLVSTQRLGGYAVWAQRRLQLDADRYTAVVLLVDDDDPHVYLVPTTDFRDPAPPLVNRPNTAIKSEAEYGIHLSRSSLPALARYDWDERTGERSFA